jgi:hypothetical protein
MVDPNVPCRDAGEEGHDAGLSEGSAMQTRPVAALALGTRLGSTRTIDRARKISGRIVLDFFKYFHYRVNSNGEISVSEGCSAYLDQFSCCCRKHPLHSISGFHKMGDDSLSVD